jgi:hypothetical protein
MEEMSISRTAGTVSDPTTKPVVKPSEIRRRRCISPCLPQLSHRSPLLCIATQPDKPAAVSRITTTKPPRRPPEKQSLQLEDDAALIKSRKPYVHLSLG